MKKILALLTIVAVIAMTATACDDGKTSTPGDSSSTTSTTAA